MRIFLSCVPSLYYLQLWDNLLEKLLILFRSCCFPFLDTYFHLLWLNLFRHTETVSRKNPAFRRGFCYTSTIFCSVQSIQLSNVLNFSWVFGPDICFERCFFGGTKVLPEDFHNFM